MAHKVLLITPSCYPTTGSEAIVNAKLVFAMIEKNWHVDVITSDSAGYGYPAGEASFWNEVQQVSRIISAKSGWNFRHLLEHMRGCFRTSHSVRGLAWSGNAYPTADKLCRNNSYNAILSRTVPQSHLLAMKLSIKYKVPWIANWNDPFPRNKFPPPYGEGKDARLSAEMSRFFKNICRYAHWHTFPCQRLLDYINSYFPDNVKNRSSVVPHIALCDTAYNRLPKIKRDNPNIFKICHSGHLDRNRDPSVFFAGLKLFLSSLQVRRDIIITFIGERTTYIEKKICQFGLERVINLVPSQNYYDSLSFLSCYDLALIIEAPCEEGVFLPSKTVDYLQLGLPILAVSPEIGTLKDFIQKNHCGWIAHNASAESVCQSLTKAYTDWSNQEFSQMELEHSLAGFRPEAVLQKYRSIIGKF